MMLTNSGSMNSLATVGEDEQEGGSSGTDSESTPLVSDPPQDADAIDFAGEIDRRSGSQSRRSNNDDDEGRPSLINRVPGTGSDRDLHRSGGSGAGSSGGRPSALRSTSERSILRKNPRRSPTPQNDPVNDDDSDLDLSRSSSAGILRRDSGGGGIGGQLAAARSSRRVSFPRNDNDDEDYHNDMSTHSRRSVPFIKGVQRPGGGLKRDLSSTSVGSTGSKVSFSVDHNDGNGSDVDSDGDITGTTGDSGNAFGNDFFANDQSCISRGPNGSARSKSSRSMKGSQRWRSAMSTSSVRTIIQSLPMFANIPDQELDDIVAGFERIDYDADEEIIRQGDPCHDPTSTYMYVVTKGECAVKVNGTVLPDPYGTLTRDAIFGELAVMDDSPRKATITAKTAVTLQRVDKAHVRKHLSQDDSIKEAVEKERAELKAIDDILDKISGVDTRYGGSIIHKFKPNRLWLWTRWRYTVIAYSYPFVLINMLLTAIIALIVELLPGSDWPIGYPPDEDHPIVAQLNTIFVFPFNLLSGLATFVLTFFLAEAFGLWKQMYFTVRKIQAGLNEINMFLAIGAARDDMKEYTDEAEAALDDVAHFVRLYHLFMWGKFAKNYSVVVTTKGMARMLSRGLITNDQFRCLQVQDNGINPHHTCIEWIGLRVFKAMEEGAIKDDFALKQEILGRLTFVRSSQSDVGDIIEGRMSLAYAHLVQMLVDVLLVCAPFALYAQQGIWAILTVGIYTVFYAGVLDLSKMYLDPLDNDNYYNDSVNMDLGVLMNEMNIGAVEWKKGAMFVPF